MTEKELKKLSSLTLEEVNSAVKLIQEVVSSDANTIFGATIDEAYNDRMIVTIVATGFEGSRFENATNGAQGQRPAGPSIPNIPGMQPKQNPETAGFDKSRFNDFVAGKPTMVSLFKREEENAAPKNLQTPSFIQQAQPQAKPNRVVF